MAWIAASHQRLIMPHPHSAFHGPNGAHPALGRLASHSPSAASAGGGGAGVEDVLFPCDICGKHFTSKDVLRQHMLAHAQPRPFVCEHCDAGFTTQLHLESHLVLHRPRTS